MLKPIKFHLGSIMNSNNKTSKKREIEDVNKQLSRIISKQNQTITNLRARNSVYEDFILRVSREHRACECSSVLGHIGTLKCLKCESKDVLDMESRLDLLFDSP